MPRPANRIRRYCRKGSGAAIFRTRSASPRAMTRTPTRRKQCGASASALSRSARSPPGRSRAIRSRGSFASNRIAPDLTAIEREDIAAVALAAGIDGLVVANTTVERPAGLASRHAREAGGLSGRPLFSASTVLLSDMYRLTQGRLLLIGVGGIA